VSDSPNPIFQRLCDALNAAILNTDSEPQAFYLGSRELRQFDEWTASQPSVPRQVAGYPRREFMGFPIYRVDDDEHLRCF
jgi:hypothetical protein